MNLKGKIAHNLYVSFFCLISDEILIIHHQIDTISGLYTKIYALEKYKILAIVSFDPLPNEPLADQRSIVLIINTALYFKVSI